MIYAVTDDEADVRHQSACDLLVRLAPLPVILPLPVIGEFLNVCRKRKRPSFIAALERADRMIRIYNCVAANPSDYLRAGTTSHRYQIQFFDALILSVAARAGATLLLSEDMVDGLEVEGVRIVNPFNPANDAVIAAALI